MVAVKNANLFVVGAMRAGTTSFMELLAQHPEIYTSPIKEPHFFTETLPKEIFEPLPPNYLEHYFKKQFPLPIHRAHLKNIEEYTKLFENATTEKYLAEGSISYLNAPGVPERIKRYNPEAKIIILTRNPLERAISHYKMNVGLFREKRSFETAIQEEIDAYYKNELPWYSYLQMSFYKDSIAKYEQCFGNNVMVINLEDLVLETKKIGAQLSSFLEVASFEIDNFPQRNKTRKLRFKKVLSMLHRLHLKQLLYSVLPAWGKTRVKNVFLSDNTDLVKMSKKTREILLAIFQKEC